MVKYISTVSTAVSDLETKISSVDSAVKKLVGDLEKMAATADSIGVHSQLGRSIDLTSAKNFLTEHNAVRFLSPFFVFFVYLLDD